MAQRVRLMVLMAFVTVSGAATLIAERWPDTEVSALPEPAGRTAATGTSVAEDRAIVSSVQTVVVLGDASRTPEGGVAEPASTLIETTVVTSIVPDPALCHAEHPNAVAVSDAIRTHFPSGTWATMCRIAWCESTFNPRARNPSGATGIFQIMPFWFKSVPDADPWTINGSARLARHVYNEQGFPAWSCY